MSLAQAQNAHPRPLAARIPAAEPPLPKGVWFQPKTLKDGARVRYGYYGRGPGAMSLGCAGTPEFARALASLSLPLAGSPPAFSPPPDPPPGPLPRTGFIVELCRGYRASLAFARLRAPTKLAYRRKLDLIQGRFGAMTQKDLEAPAFAGEVQAWLDAQASAPRQADYGVQVLKVLLSWACRHGRLAVNRAAGVARRHRPRPGGKAWRPDQVRAFLATAPAHLRLALILALETGQRQGDLLALTWSSIGDDIISLTQSKTGVNVAAPITPALRAALDAWPGPRRGKVLRRADGRPWNARGNGFRNAWRTAAKAAGVQGVRFHDLRATFITQRLGALWTPLEVAMCSGHALRNLACLDIYADRQMLAEITATRRAAGRIEARRAAGILDPGLNLPNYLPIPATRAPAPDR